MLLSIVIPVYNSAKYVEECINSCVKQDIDSNEYEIICVDDGSTDGSYNIIQSIMESFHNVRLIRQPNSGVSSARNHGLSIANGDFIWFIDSDDFIAENVLGKLKTLVNTKKPDRLLIQSYCFMKRYRNRNVRNEIKVN